MANVNITDLTSLTAPATADELEVYDASASENKRITLANLLKSTDTLPLATYTLTVPATGTAALLAAANAFTGANTMQNSGGVGLAIGVAGDSNYRKGLHLLADAPHAIFTTTSGKLNWAIAPQFNVDQAFEFMVGGTDTDGSNDSFSTAMYIGQNKEFAIVDGITAPSTASGYALIYVDTADGDLKVKFGDGHTAVLAADS